jgi:cyclopropane fatty-acyl-phospholipid synthase-like methyltransferase
LLEEIGDGNGARALDVGCGALGWLRVLSEWVGPDGEVTGTDVDERMLAAAGKLVAEEGFPKVTLVRDDLFDSSLAPAERSCSRIPTPAPGTSIRRPLHWSGSSN